MTRSLPAVALAGVVGLGCADAWRELPPPDPTTYRVEHDAWRDWRRGRLLAPATGPLIWLGLWELPEGETRFGADSSFRVVLPAQKAPLLAGTITRAGAHIRLHPASGVDLTFADSTPVTAAMVLRTDADGAATDLRLGSLGIRIHEEPRGSYWVRVWDEAHESIGTFTGAPQYPLDARWRLPARFERFREPQRYRVPDVTGGIQEYAAPGLLVFRAEGREHRLIPFADSDDEEFWILFADSTNATTTYQGGRYVRAPLPDAGGWTTIDFNRAYNPPCAFTPFSTCALPPWENRLALAVTAGEQRPK